LNWVNYISGNIEADRLAFQGHTIYQTWAPLVEMKSLPVQLQKALADHLSALAKCAIFHLKVEKTGAILGQEIDEYWSDRNAA
jgi:ubiquitin-protein ligase